MRENQEALYSLESNVEISLVMCLAKIKKVSANAFILPACVGSYTEKRNSVSMVSEIGQRIGEGGVGRGFAAGACWRNLLICKRERRSA